MTATAPDFDFNESTLTDIPSDEFTSIPDHTASRENRRRKLTDYLGAKKPDDDDEKPKATRRTVRRKKPAPRAKKGAFVEPLQQFYGLLGVTLMPFDQHCAQAVLTSAEGCAQAMDELAYQNEAVRRALQALTTGSAMGAVIVAHLPIVMAVASHHMPGKIPTIPGITVPAANAEDTPGE